MKILILIAPLLLALQIQPISVNAQNIHIKDISTTGFKGREIGDGFGNAVAVSDSIMVVAARWQDFDATGRDSLSSAGAVYVFYRNKGGKDNWGQVKKIVAEGLNERNINDQFGWSVAISGNTIVVGTWLHYYGDSIKNPLNFLLGAAFVYSKDEGGKDNWGQVKKLVANGPRGREVGDRFGYSLSISEDIIAVGTPRQDFDETGEGYSIDAGAVYMYYKNEGGTNNWGLKKKIIGVGFNGRYSDDYFGQSVAIVDDMLVVGAPGQDYNDDGTFHIDGTGSAYVFYKDNGGVDDWGLQRKLTGGGVGYKRTDNKFGWSVAATKNTIAVGAIDQDFDSDDENFLEKAGAVYVYSRNKLGKDAWGQVKKIVASGTKGRREKGNFGEIIAVSDNTICVGDPFHSYDANDTLYSENAGAVFVYSKDRGGINNWGAIQKLVDNSNKGRRSDDLFGYSVALLGDTAFVGSPWTEYDANGENWKNSAGKLGIYKVDPSYTISVEEISSSNYIEVSSFEKNILINFLDEGNYEILINDLLGRNLKKQKISVDKCSIERFNLEGISPGYYIVTIRSNKYYQSSKVFLN